MPFVKNVPYPLYKESRYPSTDEPISALFIYTNSLLIVSNPCVNGARNTCNYHIVFLNTRRIWSIIIIYF